MSLNQYQRRRNQTLVFTLLKPFAQFPTMSFGMDELDRRGRIQVDGHALPTTSAVAIIEDRI